MQSLFNYIISTNTRYNNTIKIENKELIVNTEISERDHVFVNRVAHIIQIPVYNNSILKKGDEIIVHHNVFRRWLDMHGNEKNSSGYFKEMEYFVELDQIFAYKRDNKWISLPNYCFVKPVYKNDKWGLKTDENLSGVLTYSNDGLNSLGVAIGDVVGFTPNSEYEFEIEGEKLYRILSNHITINYGKSQAKNNISC